MEGANWNDKLQMGDFIFDNRIVMASLTRERCDPKLSIPTDMLVEYYTQRVGGAFILTEGVAWTVKGRGSFGAPCLYNEDQMRGWKKVVDAVHAKGGKIFIQLFHCGRVGHPDKSEGNHPLAPSPVQVRQPIRDMPGVDFPVPKEMTQDDIDETFKDFQQSVKYAVQAGFDGVQLHAANGHLIHNFISSYTNRRTDKWGGSIQNRMRFVLELVDITLKHFKACRVGVKLSPTSRVKDNYDQAPLQSYPYLLKELDKRKIGFIELKESTQYYAYPNKFPTTQQEQIPDVCKAFRPLFSGIIIGNESFTPETGIAKIRAGLCDAISFGRLYISNPDLAQRILNNWELSPIGDMSTFYGYKNGAKGYIDYPFYKQKQ